MTEIKRKQVCKCEHCGNEAEMVFTCTLADAETPADAESTTAKAPAKKPAASDRVLGHATCSHCGSEADMWIDL
jgi:hypothetical protein